MNSSFYCLGQFYLKVFFGTHNNRCDIIKNKDIPTNQNCVIDGVKTNPNV